MIFYIVSFRCVPARGMILTIAAMQFLILSVLQPTQCFAAALFREVNRVGGRERARNGILCYFVKSPKPLRGKNVEEVLVPHGE